MHEAGHQTLNVVIVEDDAKLRDAYLNLINSQEGMCCVGSLGSVEEAMKTLEDLLPDVVLMDIGLPGMSGIEGIRRVKALLPSTDVVMLTVYDDEEKIFQSICSGASGYLLKNTDPREFIQAINGIKHGAPISAAIASRVLEIVRRQAAPFCPEFHLTPREIDILHSLVEGLSERKTADRLFISPQTVHSHIKHIYEKLHVHSKAEAVAKAVRNKISP